MNLFERMKQTILADLHDVLDKKEMKNPISLLNQYLRDCEKEAKNVGTLINRHYQLKDEFYREWKQAGYMCQKRKEQCDLAEIAGEVELLQMAQAEQQQYEARAEHLKASYEEKVQQLSQLEQKHREMKLKIKDMQIKRMELMGRENVARVTQKMNQAMYATEMDRAFTRFDEVEHYITNLESRINGKYERNMLDDQFFQLEKTLQAQGSATKVDEMNQ